MSTRRALILAAKKRRATLPEPDEMPWWVPEDISRDKCLRRQYEHDGTARYTDDVRQDGQRRVRQV